MNTDRKYLQAEFSLDYWNHENQKKEEGDITQRLEEIFDIPMELEMRFHGDEEEIRERILEVLLDEEEEAEKGKRVSWMLLQSQTMVCVAMKDEINLMEC